MHFMSAKKKMFTVMQTINTGMRLRQHIALHETIAHQRKREYPYCGQSLITAHYRRKNGPAFVILCFTQIMSFLQDIEYDYVTSGIVIP